MNIKLADRDGEMIDVGEIVDHGPIKLKDDDVAADFSMFAEKLSELGELIRKGMSGLDFDFSGTARGMAQFADSTFGDPAPTISDAERERRRAKGRAQRKARRANRGRR